MFGSWLKVIVIGLIGAFAILYAIAVLVAGEVETYAGRYSSQGMVLTGSEARWYALIPGLFGLGFLVVAYLYWKSEISPD
jgi:hypothetical protein